MGLAAGQARYLFISSRCIDLEKGLMSLSMKELALKDRANDIAEARDYATNLQHLEFNGNKNFSYDDMMGEAALNNGQLYYLTTNDGSNKVVLDSRYAAGMKAAGISADGGEFTNNGYDAFLNSVAGKPQSAKNWIEVRTGKLSDTSAYSPIDAFKSEYGVAAPKQGEDKSKPITHTETYTTYSYKSTSDFAKLLGTANLECGYGDSESNKTVQPNKINATSWESIANGQQSVLYLGRHGNGHKDSTSQYVYNQMRKIINNLGVSAKNAGFDATAVSKATQKVSQEYTKDINCIGKTKYVNVVDASKNKTGIYSGRKSGSHDRWYTVDLKPMFQMFYNELKSAMGTAAEGNKAANGTQNTKTVVDGYEHYTNSNGKTFEEWTAAWNKVIADNKLDETLAKEYLTSGKVSIEPSQDDINMMNRYEAIYLKALSQGWTEDNQVYNQEYLTGKLQNVSYLVNAEAMKNSEAFATVRTNDADQVKAYYDKEEREISREEKKIEIEKNSKQTELNALQTELQSAKSIIDKNVERGFNLFG